MKIGKLAALAGCSVQTIRYYEQAGLLASARRSEGNFRLYDNTALAQLLFIKNCRGLDLSLAEIRQLLDLNRSPEAGCDGVNRLIDTHIRHVEQRIAELEELRSQLTALRQHCGRDRTVDQCGILQGLGVAPGRGR